jgi:acetyl esterase/lipase
MCCSVQRMPTACPVNGRSSQAATLRACYYIFTAAVIVRAPILSHRRLVTEAGRAAGIRTLAAGYRLALEHPFPAGLNDALAIWRWLRGEGVAAAHIAVGGDSAGAGLAVALIKRVRDAGEGLPGCAWLVSRVRI